MSDGKVCPRCHISVPDDTLLNPVCRMCVTELNRQRKEQR